MPEPIPKARLSAPGRKIAMVVQRYGADVTGGSESLARSRGGVAVGPGPDDQIVVAVAIDVAAGSFADSELIPNKFQAIGGESVAQINVDHFG